METSPSLANEELSFEEAMRELELITATLEAGQVPLERLFELVERGRALASHCDLTISQVELKLEQLIMTPDGELVTEEIEGDDEDDE